MINKENIQKELSVFARSVVKSSRQNLTKMGKNSSKKLYDSLGSELNVSKNSFSLSFLMEKHGEFQDKGVKGANPSNVSPNAKIKGQQAPNSPFKFGSGNYRGQWGEFVSSLEVWAKRKNLRLRDDKGRFVKGSYNSIAYILARNIYSRGIKPSLFFTRPFEGAFKKLPDDVTKAFGLDMEEFLKFTLNK
jgi:hypothetical protein